MEFELFRARWRKYYDGTGGDPYFNPDLADDRDNYWIRG